MNHDSIEAYVRGAIELEAAIMERSLQIREESKIAYGNGLLDARLMCIALIYRVVRCKELIPGITSEKLSQQLQLTTMFIQGLPVTETLISEGQYSKAAAALKQDYEGLARIHEIEKGVAKLGETPQIRHAPEESRRYYGQLNDIAHPSNPKVLDQLLERYSTGTIKGLSPLPTFVKETALAMYELHVWLCFEFARESIKLLINFYSADDKAVQDCMLRFEELDAPMVAAGFALK